MQVMIKTKGLNGELIEKGPIVLNRFSIQFIEKITPITKNDIRSQNMSYESKADADDMYENNIWIIVLNNNSQLWVSGDTVKKIESWLEQ